MELGLEVEILKENVERFFFFWLNFLFVCSFVTPPLVRVFSLFFPWY